MIEIERRVIGCSVVTPVEPRPETARPESLSGATYKIKSPLSEHAFYVTINDRDGHPFEIFVNSKSQEHFQWVVGLTRIVSMVFRQKGPLDVLCDELRSVFDPKGGHFEKGRFVPSLVASIGGVVERHCVGLGLIARDTSLVDAARAMVAEKAAENGSKCG